MIKTIANIKNVKIAELPQYKTKGIHLVDDNLFEDEPLLSEAHRMSEIACPVPSSNEAASTSSWHCCSIFGNRYAHGMMNGLNGRQLESLRDRFCYDSIREKYPTKKSMEKDQKGFIATYKASLQHFCYDVLKPVQDKYLDDMKDRFLSQDIVATMLALDIDIEQFWDALLWLKDFIDDRTDSAIEYYDSPLESYQKMICLLGKVADVDNNLEQEYEPSSEVKGTLTLKVDGNRKLVVSNPDTLKLLGNILSDYLKANEASGSDGYAILRQIHEVYENKGCNHLRLEGKPRQVSYLAKIYLFHTYMSKYLSEYSSKKNLSVADVITEMSGVDAGKLVSVDKELLISRLVWVVGYGDKKRFCDNPRAVKDALKGFNTNALRHLVPNEYEY